MPLEKGCHLSGVAAGDMMQDMLREAEVAICQAMLLQKLWDEMLLRQSNSLSAGHN